MKRKMLAVLGVLGVAVWMAATVVATAVEVDSDAPRVISFSPGATECLFFVGLGPWVVGRSPYCDYPEAVKALPVVGDLQRFDEKGIAKAAPTHAVVSSMEQGVVPYLRALGVEVLVARTDTEDEVQAFLERLGETFGAYTNGVLPTWKAQLRETDGRVSGRRAALLLDSAEGARRGCMVAGRGSYYDSLLRQVGYTNAFGELRGFTTVSPEALLKARVEVLFVVGFERGAETISREWRAWVGEGVEVVPLVKAWAYRPGPRMVELKRALAR